LGSEKPAIPNSLLTSTKLRYVFWNGISLFSTKTSTELQAERSTRKQMQKIGENFDQYRVRFLSFDGMW
jgi:hypothetical protein